MRSSMARATRSLACLAALVTAPACGAGSAEGPHVDHINLPTHKVWRVVSVTPYSGLEEVELVRVDWPTADDPRAAFALTREGLRTGDPICLDHVVEIDALWAHPVPEGGCSALPRVPKR
jgi:hypothetical protein